MKNISNTFKIVSLIFVVFSIFILLVFKKYIYKKHENISLKNPDLVISADKLYYDFINFTDSSNSKYLNKIIIIDGNLISLDDRNILLSPGISILLEKSTTEINRKEEIKIKGRCLGFDNILMEVKIDKATLIN